MTSKTASATRLMTTVWKYADCPFPYPPPPQPYPELLLLEVVAAAAAEEVIAVRGFTKRSDDVGAVGNKGVVVDMSSRYGLLLSDPAMVFRVEGQSRGEKSWPRVIAFKIMRRLTRSNDDGDGKRFIWMCAVIVFPCCTLINYANWM